MARSCGGLHTGWYEKGMAFWTFLYIRGADRAVVQKTQPKSQQKNFRAMQRVNRLGSVCQIGNPFSCPRGQQAGQHA